MQKLKFSLYFYFYFHFHFKLRISIFAIPYSKDFYLTFCLRISILVLSASRSIRYSLFKRLIQRTGCGFKTAFIAISCKAVFQLSINSPSFSPTLWPPNLSPCYHTPPDKFEALVYPREKNVPHPRVHQQYEWNLP